MAKKAAKAAGKGSKGGKGGKAPPPGATGSAPVSGYLIFAFICVLIPFSLPTMLLLFAGMLPTLISALTDRSNSRYAWICVGGLNFAGLAPALLRLWFGHHEITFALHQVTDLHVLLLAYGAASAGWVLYFGAPPIVITIMVATTKRRATTMVQQMKKLEEEWGEEVISRSAMSDGGL